MPSYDPSLFNVDPYYDDFSEDKKFLRMMFRPGYGVQARELTQMQSILQNQIERIGSHIFEEGSIVLDGQINESRTKYARVTANTTDPNDFKNVVFGRPGRASMRVSHAESGLGVTSDNYTVLFFDYIDGGTGFQYNDVISGTAANGATITATVTGPSQFATPVGDGILVSVNRGVRYVEGYFVYHTPQTIGAYSLSGSGDSQVRVFANPTTRIGFDVVKEFVTASEDESLNDPAFGFYNYAAPGSDRFVIDLQLGQYGFTATDTSAVDNFSRVGFMEFMRIVDGDVIKVEKYPDYAMLEDTLARRTYDESGNYTVRPFSLELKGPTSISENEVVLKAELGSGKAYIFGYEFETQAKAKLNLACARGEDHERQVTRNFSRFVGSTTKVTFTGLSGSIGITTDFGNHPEAYLYAGCGENMLGTARIRGVELFSPPIYDLGLYDIHMTTGTFSDVRKVFVGQTAVAAFELTGDAGLENESQGNLLYRIPEGTTVKSFEMGDFAIVSHDKRTCGSLPFTFTLTESTNNLNVLPSTDDPVGDITINPDILVFDEDGNVCGGSAQRTSAQQLQITITSNTAQGKQLHIITTREPGNDTLSMGTSVNGFVRGKTVLTENITLSGKWASLTGDGGGTTSDTLYFNGLVDLIDVIALTGSMGASSGINLLPFFTFDDGQRDSMYDWARMTLSEGITGISGPYTATISRFGRNGNSNSKGFYTVASYSDYENIPSYRSRSTGDIYELRDCIDFRPDRSLNGDIQSRTWIPSNSSANDNTFTYTHYLSRTDKIALTRDRNFVVIEGIPSLDGIPPENNPNAMTLYSVTLNPYTFSNKDASIRFVENKRYTMRDIGELERRIEAVEYYYSLNMLEQEAKNTPIRDESGEEMPKKGILVDQFVGHAVADNKDPLFSISVDEINNVIRPENTTRSYDMKFLGEDSSDVTGNAEDGLYMLEFTESPEINNLLASQWQPINPFAVLNFNGSMTISPSTDIWFDDKVLPVVQSNVEGQNDNFAITEPEVVAAIPPKTVECTITFPAYGWFVGTYWNKNSSIYNTVWNQWLKTPCGKDLVRRKVWGGVYGWWRNRWFGFPFQDGNWNVVCDWNKRDWKYWNNRWSTCKATLVAPAKPADPPKIIPPTPPQTVKVEEVKKDVVPYARARDIKIKASGLKPNTTFRVFCDDMDVSAFCTGQSLETNYRGEVTDLTYYFNTPSVSGSNYTGPEQKFLVGRHLIRVADSPLVETSTMSAEALYTVEGNISSSDTGDQSTRPLEVKKQSVNSETVISSISDMVTSSGEIRGYTEPMSQTFYVDEERYPSGIFVKSVDLYFKTKDTMESMPVTLQIRPTEAGYPHPSKILPFATSVVYPESIQTSDLIADGNSNRANFAFSTPVYLLPGTEYAISISTNSLVHTVFTGLIGASILRQTEEAAKNYVTKQPMVRSLFKPQNTGNMIKAVNESLVFRLNLCKFQGLGKAVFANMASPEEEANLNINEFRVNSGVVLPEGSRVTYSANVGGVAFPSIQANTDIRPTIGYVNVTNSDQEESVLEELEVFMYSDSNKYVTPVFDVQRSSIMTVSNIINNNKVTDRTDPLYNGELDPTNEGIIENFRAASRYITKKVTLEEGMEAENITVLMSLCNPKGALDIVPSIKVFVKAVPIGENADNVGYIELTTEDNGVSASDEDFREVKYTNIGNGALPRYRTFCVKICMFGDETGASVPKVKNLRIIAT